MPFQTGLAIVGIIIVIFALIPTIDILTLRITIPPDQSNNVLIENRLTILQYYTSDKQSPKYGNIEVNVTLQNSANEIKFKQTYFLGKGTWTITTYQPVSKNDIAIVEISSISFKKVINIGQR